MNFEIDSEEAFRRHVQTVVRTVADSILERGRKFSSGEPLFFDRHNLELAIGDAVLRVFQKDQ